MLKVETNLSAFRKLENLLTFKDRLQYCKDNFKRLGAGSSRIAFDYDDQTVLKLAKNSLGILQCQSEYHTFKNAVERDLFASVEVYASGFTAVLQQKVIRIKQEYFVEKFGITFDELDGFLSDLEDLRTRGKPRMKSKLFSSYEAGSAPEEAYCFLGDLETFIRGFNFPTADFRKLDSWGVTPAGDPVLLDYGVSQEVMDAYTNKVSRRKST